MLRIKVNTGKEKEVEVDLRGWLIALPLGSALPRCKCSAIAAVRQAPGRSPVVNLGV